MFKYAEDELLKELDKLENEVEPIKEELDNIKERLENITKYNNLQNNNSINGIISFICFLFGSGLGGFDIISLNNFLSANVLKNGIGFLITLGTISVALLGVMGLGIKYIASNNKEIKELKWKGVKKDKKEESILLEKKEELTKENNICQEKIEQVNKVLDHINFYNEKKDNIYYQADTKEDFFAKLDKVTTFNSFLQEKPDYSKIHSDSFVEPVTLENDNMILKKVLK